MAGTCTYSRSRSRSKTTKASAGNRLDRLDRLSHVAHAVVAGLALDGERAGVVNGLQRVEETLRPDLAGAERHFLAPLDARLGGRRGVLHVDVADKGRERRDCADRVAEAVEDHVGRVEIDEDV